MIQGDRGHLLNHLGPGHHPRGMAHAAATLELIAFIGPTRYTL